MRLEARLGQASQIAGKSLAADSPQLAAANASLGRALLAQKRAEEAAPLLRQSYPILAKANGEDALITKRTKEALATAEARVTAGDVH